MPIWKNQKQHIYRWKSLKCKQTTNIRRTFLNDQNFWNLHSHAVFLWTISSSSSCSYLSIHLQHWFLSLGMLLASMFAKHVNVTILTSLKYRGNITAQWNISSRLYEIVHAGPTLRTGRHVVAVAYFFNMMGAVLWLRR